LPLVPGPAPASPIPPGPSTVRNVCTNALYEINVVAPGEQPDSLELAFVLDKFNQLVDSWNTQQVYIFASDLLSSAPPAPMGNGAQFILTPSLSPHTIGPKPIAGAGPPPPQPSFQVINERPVRMKSANVLLSNVNPIVRFPLEMRDKDWWAKQRVQTIQTSLPTDLYYRPDWPLGSLFFWPVPNFAYQVEFEVETILQGGLTLNSIFTAPPGYELAITLTLAELLCPSFEKPPNQLLLQAASRARQNVQGLNASAPRIDLAGEFGDSGTARPRASFNYHTGLDR
jgi:hypothetical protein